MLLSYTVAKLGALAQEKSNLVHQTVSPRERVGSGDEIRFHLIYSFVLSYLIGSLR